MVNRNVFQPGKLREHVRDVAKEALTRGALEPIETDLQFLVDRNIRFIIRTVVGRPDKPRPDTADYDAVDRYNPFLPYDPMLYVADVSPTHVCLLNKYNVVDHHLLVITRQFEHQESPLNTSDFYAMWRCMREYDSLGFYNSGVIAGASQPHKHLQVVPLPLAPHGLPIPTEPLLISKNGSRPGLCQADALPFAHQLYRWNTDPTRDLAKGAEQSHRAYRMMLDSLGIRFSKGPRKRVSGPYNLLVTRDWMLLVPRANECHGRVSLNALAFAGALLLHDACNLVELETAGPFAALQSVAVSRPDT